MSYWNSATGSNSVENHSEISKYYGPLKCSSSTQVDFTGSNHGYSAIIVENATNVTFTAKNDVAMAAGCFTAGQIYDIAPKKVVIGATGVVYALKKRGI